MLTVVGMGPAGLQWLIPAAREAIAAAEALVGGSRHLQQFPDFAGERFALGADMPALLAWIEARTGRRVGSWRDGVRSGRSVVGGSRIMPFESAPGRRAV